MKSLYLLALIFLCISANASTTYYVSSSSGSDSNNGTSSSTPFQTIGKVNSLSLKAGDQVLFKRGDTFYGEIVISHSGSSGNPITYSAYGTGTNPIITGFTTVSSWTNLGSNIWESTSTVSSLSSCKMVMINGVNTPMGRYPNSGWLTFQSHSGTTSITSSQLSGTPNYTNGDCVIRLDPVNVDKSTITSQSGGTLNLAGLAYAPTNGFGFFIQNDSLTLDSQNEWWYSKYTHKIRVYNTSNPGTLNVASVDILFSIGSYTYITINGLDFKGANSYAIYNKGNNFTVTNCHISYCGLTGIYTNSITGDIEHNYLTDCNYMGIDGEGANGYTIQYNTVRRTEVFPGATNNNYRTAGINAGGYSAPAIIQYNVIDSSGYKGIIFQGNNSKVAYNLVENVNIIQGDGSAIYTASSSYTGEVIDHNIILNVSLSDSAGQGGNGFMGKGINLDDDASNIQCTNNTIAYSNAAGMFLHRGTHNSIQNNTVFDCKGLNFTRGAFMIQADQAGKTNNNTIKNNIWSAVDASQYCFFNYNTSSDADAKSYGVIDSNYFVRAIGSQTNFIRSLVGSTSSYYNVIGWSSYSGYDTYSHATPKVITSVDSLLFVYNPTMSDSTITLHSKYIDAKGTQYNNGSIILHPFTSAVLIRNGSLTGNSSPVANAGQDQTITLPTNSLTLTGSGTDADGTITNYQWVKISGPSSFNLVSPTTSNTSVTGLVQGVYQFQLTVTDNNGATGKDTIQVTVNPAPNQPPVANAGQDQTITLPTNNVTLNGSGTDPDGTITSYAWTKVSGPSSYNITNINSAATTVTGLVQGTYQFQLKVTDNNGATGTDVILVTVSPATNQPPVADAGGDQTITLPVNSVTLNGSGTDADGTIASYLWTELSGPSSAPINNANSASTSVSSLIQGTYQFELTVTDDSGAIGTATMLVVVNPAINVPPVANAGSNQTITLPANSVTLRGSGTDADGSITAYQWAQLSGPSSSTIVDASSASTNVTGLVQGVYQFQLQVTDNSGAVGIATVQIIVNAAANIPPVANAGPNQSITLPVNSVTLNGNGTDSDGTVVSYQWTELSGPSGYSITSPNSASTDITGLVLGVYQFQLQVTDNAGATGIAVVQVTVNQAANIPPVANAGSNQAINLPTDSVILSGSGTDADGAVVSYQWTELSGPSFYSISDSSSAITSVTGLIEGTYQFQLEVTDNDGATSAATVQVTVNAAANIPPVADAGGNQTITLPTNSVTLNGNGTDADGSVVSYLWTKISGPSLYSIVTPGAATTNVSGLVQGTYQFQLQVTDNLGATGTALVQVVVNSSTNIAPVADAGSNQTITLPVDSVTLSGSGTDADGTIVSYKWTKTSGPSSYNIVNPDSASTTVKGLVAGTYRFQLTVTDNSGASNSNSVKIVVKSASNIPPVANAGSDQTITLPANSVTLSGSGTDADGTIVAYKWTKISGPPSYTIVNSNSATTSVTGLVQGVYKFQLTVTDNKGAVGTSTMLVTVNAPANQPPVADAGTNQTITLPTDYTTLSGSGTDPDGTIVSYQWTKISGPASYDIANASAATTNTTGLVQGVYQFQLQVTDNNGATGTATVQITVDPAANVPPVANAGIDQVVTLPTNSVTLAGSGTDADGTIVNYQWAEISGPSSYNIVNANSSSTNIDGLVEGVYQFQLQVTDNNGAVGADVVQVTVNPAPNIPPVADAGADQIITLPIDSVSLNGSGTDADGTIISYQWTEISGPSISSIASSNSASTEVNGLVEGTYQFQLQVSDNSGAISSDMMIVTVDPAANILPVANAGSDQTITLPLSSVTLSGSGTDVDGTIVGYQWTQISGPANSTILNSNSASTNVTGLVQGVYQFQLQVTDNSGGTGTADIQVTVNPPLNIPPVADAGSNQSITLPTNSVTLSGSGTDADGTIVSYQWTKVSGPSSYSIANTNAPITDITGLVQGVYQFQLSVTDNDGAIGTDVVTIIVNPAPNQAPVANAGSDQTITLPRDSITLNGGGTDADGSVIAYRWTKISGPSTYTIANRNSATTAITGLVKGIYQFQLRVTDNDGAIGTDIVQVTVNPAPNQPPVADAGSDQTITLPVNSVTLAGSGTDADGTIVSYKWTELSGPSTGVITNSTASTTTAHNLVQGTYKFQLQVTDNDGATANAVVQVIVNPAPNQPPLANAGSDQTITLPTNKVTLTGSGTDADGTITSYQWTKVSGPSSFNIINANAAATSVTGLKAGTYQFQLKVTDNSGAIATDIVQVTVNPAPNQPPTANAGPDKAITLPTNSTTLNGSGTDADGTITSYQWTKVSGPSSYTITDANSASVNITGLVQGTYQFQLEVTDNNGAKSNDVVKLTVNPAANIPPVANAGPDKVITLPINMVTLSGNGTDADGSIVAYQWVKIAGPATYDISNSTSASTDVGGLAQGVYLFELRVTDNSGARGRDTVQITVNRAPNVPPVAFAGADQTVILPNNDALLTGSGTDADGIVVSYKWVKMSGPSSYRITNPASPVTDAWQLTQGVYKFVLTVTDNDGATGSDTVQITVIQSASTNLAANAGRDQTITLPTDSAKLVGSGIVTGGTITRYYWLQISGPSSSVVLSPTNATTMVQGLIGGTYEFELTVTDSSGNIAKDTVAVIVTEPRLSTTVASGLKVFPNPVIDVTTLQINTSQVYTRVLISVSDIYGNIVYSTEIKPSTTDITLQLNLSNLAKGTYVVLVNYGNNQKQSLKLLKL